MQQHGNWPEAVEEARQACQRLSVPPQPQLRNSQELWNGISWSRRVLPIGTLDQPSVHELRTCPNERHEFWRVDPSPPPLGRLVTSVRARTGANVDSIGLEVRRWIQCSAG